MGVRFGGELDQSVDGKLDRLERRVNALDYWQVVILLLLLASSCIGCAMTTGDPYAESVPCYEGPIIVEKLAVPTPTPTPTPEPEP